MKGVEVGYMCSSHGGDIKYGILVGKCSLKKPLRRCLWWENITKTESDCSDPYWIELIQHKGGWRSFVLTGMNFRIP